MTYDKDEIFDGSVLRSDIDGVFEGYIKLLRQDGECLPQMEHDQSPVILSCRYLVQFVDPIEVDMMNIVLPPNEVYTQRAQKCRSTHRRIKYQAGTFAEVYKTFKNSTVDSISEEEDLREWLMAHNIESNLLDDEFEGLY